MLNLSSRVFALAALCSVAWSNTITIYNKGAIGQTLVWLSNPGECAPLNDLDFIAPGGSLLKNDPILSQQCITTEWAGRFRTIPGDTKFAGSYEDALAATDAANSPIAEFCFNAFAGRTFYDFSRVNLGCTPQTSGVKWIYPVECTTPECQSGCGGDAAACWNAYVYSVNDIMQLSHTSTNYVVILGDTDYTHCDPTGPGGAMVCCTNPAGCSSAGPNTPEAVISRNGVVVYSCPLVADAAPTAAPSAAPVVPPTSPPVTTSSLSVPSSSIASLPEFVPSSPIDNPDDSSSTSAAFKEDMIATSPGTTATPQPMVIMTETTWVVETTTETACAENPYGCYGEAAPTGGLSKRAHAGHAAAHHKHALGLRDHKHGLGN